MLPDKKDEFRLWSHIIQRSVQPSTNISKVVNRQSFVFLGSVSHLSSIYQKTKLKNSAFRYLGVFVLYDWS